MLRVSGKRWNLSQVFVEGDLEGPCLEFSRIGFLSMSDLDLQSLAQCISLWQCGLIFEGFLFFFFSFFFSFLREVPFKSFLFPRVKHPSFPFLKAATTVSASICIF